MDRQVLALFGSIRVNVGTPFLVLELAFQYTSNTFRLLNAFHDVPIFTRAELDIPFSFLSSPILWTRCHRGKGPRLQILPQIPRQAPHRPRDGPPGAER